MIHGPMLLDYLTDAGNKWLSQCLRTRMSLSNNILANWSAVTIQKIDFAVGDVEGMWRR